MNTKLLCSIFKYITCAIYGIVLFWILLNMVIVQVMLHPSYFILRNEILTRFLYASLYITMGCAVIILIKKLLGYNDERSRKGNRSFVRSTLAIIKTSIVIILSATCFLLLVRDLVGYVFESIGPLYLFDRPVVHILILPALVSLCYDAIRRLKSNYSKPKCYE